MTIVRTNNQAWGFWGSMSRIGADAPSAWPVAIRKIIDATGFDGEAARDFLDSRHGRHFADDVSNALAAGAAIDAAIGVAVGAWMNWKVGKRLHAETGIPRGLPYLTGLVGHVQIVGEAE